MIQSLCRSAMRPVKRMLVAGIRASPISSVHFGPPKRNETSTKEWVSTAPPSCGASYFEVSPIQWIQRNPPLTLDFEVHWKFTRWYEQEHLPCFVSLMRNGRIWGRNGAVITPEDCLLRDVSRESDSTERTHSAFHRLRLGRLTRLDMRVAVIATAWSNVYFHWMLDVLPRLELLERAGLLQSVGAFVVPEITQPFQIQSLERLGIGPERRIEATDPWKFHIEAAELIVPSLPSRLDAPMGWACEFIREQLGVTFESATTNSRRLYLSRSKACGRRVLNETRVMESLALLGFELVQLDELSLEKQSKLFSEAGCVVGPHGAGLTNILFCRPGTVVIDIFAPTYINPCYWVIANELNLVYAYAIGEGERPQQGTDPEKRGDDLTVNVPALINLLQLVGV